jgi:hypothetical protein
LKPTTTKAGPLALAQEVPCPSLKTVLTRPCTRTLPSFGAPATTRCAMLLTPDEAARLALAEETELLSMNGPSMSIKEAKAALDPAVRRSAQRLINAGKTPTHLIVSSIVKRLIEGGGRTSYQVTLKVGDAIRRFRLAIVVDPHLPGDLVVMDRSVKLNRAQRAELDELSATPDGPGVA